MASTLNGKPRKTLGWRTPAETFDALLRPDHTGVATTGQPGQHAAHAYRRVLNEHGIPCSMSRKGNCWDNTPTEGFFGGLKTELDGDSPFETRQAARTAIFRAIEGWHNRERLHSSLRYMTPASKEELAAAA